jgi:hypothetical protein
MVASPLRGVSSQEHQRYPIRCSCQISSHPLDCWYLSEVRPKRKAFVPFMLPSRHWSGRPRELPSMPYRSRDYERLEEEIIDSRNHSLTSIRRCLPGTSAAGRIIGNRDGDVKASYTSRWTGLVEDSNPSNIVPGHGASPTAGPGSNNSSNGMKEWPKNPSC